MVKILRVPNPDEPEPKRLLAQKFLLNVQEIHRLGPYTDGIKHDRFAPKNDRDSYPKRVEL